MIGNKSPRTVVDRRGHSLTIPHLTLSKCISWPPGLLTGMARGLGGGIFGSSYEVPYPLKTLF